MGSRPDTNHLAPSETAFVQVGFKMFLNTTAAVTNWSADGTECSLVSAHPIVWSIGLPDSAKPVYGIRTMQHNYSPLKIVVSPRQGLMSPTDPGGQPLDRFCGAARGLLWSNILQCPLRHHSRRIGDGELRPGCTDCCISMLKGLTDGSW